MIGWLVVNGFLHSSKFTELTELFLHAACEEQVELIVKSNDELLVDTNLSFAHKPDFVIFWDKDLFLAQMLEMQGIRVLNSSSAIAICDDKRKTHLALQKARIATPRTIIAPMTYNNIGFVNLDFLKDVEERLGYPMIVKEAFGSFGEQVYLFENSNELFSFVSSCKTTALLFQQYIETSKGRDIRLQVVKDQVVASILRYSDTDFRANLTAGGNMKKYTPSEHECALAIQAAKAVGADFAGVDLLFGENGPLVCEVNSNAHFKNLFDCTNINTAKEIIRYIKSDIL